MTDLCKAGIEQMKPKLIEGATATKFAKDIHFVQHEGRFVKLNDEESGLMQEFNGSATLADIISKYLVKGDTGVFNRILSLITRLNKAALFDKECALVLKDVVRHKRMFQGCTKTVKTLLPKGLCAFKGKILTSIPGLIFLAALSFGSLTPPSLKGLNILKELTWGTLAPEYAYLAALAFILITVSTVISATSLCSGAALTSLGISAPVNAVFKYGLFFLSVNPVPVVSKGRQEAVKHYIMLILIPFSIAGAVAVLWQLGIFRQAMAIVYVTAFSIGLWRISPLIRSPFTMLSGFFVQGEGSTSTFLRRRFIKDLFTTKKNSAETDRLILLSTLGLIWLYGIYEYFWHVANSTLSYLLADTLSASGFTFVLISISLVFIVLPVILPLTGGLIVVLGNLGSVASTPLARMRRLADRITSKNVPSKAHIVAFLSQIPLFSGLDETALASLCSHIRLIRYGAKRKIIAQGDNGDSFYTIVSGVAEVVVENASGVEKVVETLSTGDSFGEIALLEEIPRTAGIVTKIPSAVFEIGRESFEKFVVSSAGGKEKVTDMIRFGKLLMSNPMFSFMSPRQLSHVIMKFKTEKIPAGKLFFDQGDKGDKFYLIKEGTVHIRRSEGSEVVLDRKLEQGDFFGEIALIKEVSRTAKAMAVSDCTVATLTKEEFLEIIGHSIFSGKELDSVMRERASQLGKEALKSCL
ncbi:MAG TPA: cyclic nucleotide-binding domain-containing protein [bacterium]|nr:cyclic nucleotide-binding domain-containing protein [bacterium]